MGVYTGRVPERVMAARRKEFLRLLVEEGKDPLTAARESGHPAHRALETLSALGFTLTTLPRKEAA